MLYVDRWKQEHGEPVNISNALSQIMNRVHSLEMNKGPLNDTFVDAIVEETASQVYILKFRNPFPGVVDYLKYLLIAWISPCQ